MFIARAPLDPRLAEVVERLWLYEAELGHPLERVLPTGAIQLLVNLHEDVFRVRTGVEGEAVRTIPGAAVQGVRDRFEWVDTRDQRRVVGVVLRPGAPAALLAAPGSALCNALVPVEDLDVPPLRRLRERLLDRSTPEAVLDEVEAVLVERLTPPASDRPHRRAVLAALDGARRVRDVADRFGLSDRRLVRLCLDDLGLRPKQLSRVRRFGRVLAAAAVAPRPRWAALAAAHGYADQAHLNHEFRALAGLAPSGYRPRQPTEPSHVVG